jgi:hypothetical protein
MISFIRDYLEIVSDSAVSTASSFELFQLTFQFFLKTLGNSLGYFLTFGWVRDILYLPIVLPKWQEAILSENFFWEGININLFPTLTESAQNGFISLLILGFLNSFICCLPLSTVHFLSLRRLFVQGVTAGVTSILGMVTGQCFFITLVIFGARSILIPWFNLDPLNYFLGIGLLFIVIYDMAIEKRVRPVEISEQNILIKIFATSFLLSWTEQATVGQYLSNVHFSNQSSLLTINGVGSFGGHLGYIFGLIIGHLFFSGLFLELSLLIRKGLLTISGLPYSVWVKQTNFVFLTFMLGCNLSSIPYYGLDYLITKPLGFISQDKTFEKSVFSGKNLKDPSRLLTSVEPSFPLSIDTNISHFDRDNYGEHPGFFKRNFEELNYQGEYAWIVRRDRKPDLYASGETTKTRIRNLFQNQDGDTSLDDSNKTNQTNRPPNVSEKSQNAFFSSLPIQSIDRQKLKKRFDRLYKETKEKDTYLMGDSFNTFPLFVKQQSPTEVSLKQKYYSNGVYKTLLNIEVDSFLNRQPKNYTLTTDEENQLFQKRLLLGQYYDTIRAYDKIPYYLEFNDVFQGSKSFIDRAYNHQFKGNLHVIRRLFAVTLDSKENNQQKSVLKYDMPLFRNNQKTQDYLIHEELNNHSIKGNPFLELADSTPIYFGWDNQARQMVLTTRFQPTPIFDFIGNKNLDDFPAFTQFLSSTEPIDSNLNSNESVSFTTWPIKKSRLQELKSKPNNRVMTLFEPITNPEMKRILHVANYSRIRGDNQPSLPINMRYLGKMADRLAPNHGGVVWPGN